MFNSRSWIRLLQFRLGAEPRKRYATLYLESATPKFDLVIMNPPFTRPTNHEAGHANVPIPAYAAFETTTDEQSAMSDRVKTLTRNALSGGNAGEASDFVELAHRKVRDDGSVAMVLPLSAMSGSSWDSVRVRWSESYADITVVTVAGPGSYDASFLSRYRHGRMPIRSKARASS